MSPRRNKRQGGGQTGGQTGGGDATTAATASGDDGPVVRRPNQMRAMQGALRAHTTFQQACFGCRGKGKPKNGPCESPVCLSRRLFSVMTAQPTASSPIPRTPSLAWRSPCSPSPPPVHSRRPSSTSLTHGHRTARAFLRAHVPPCALPPLTLDINTNACARASLAHRFNELCCTPSRSSLSCS